MDYQNKTKDQLIGELNKMQNQLNKLNKVADSSSGNQGEIIEANQLDAVFKASPDLLILADTNSRYLAVNPAYCQFMDKSQEELIGKTYLDIFPPEIANIYRESDIETLQLKNVKVYEREAFNVDGLKKWLQVIKSPIIDSEGKATGILTTIRDITEKKQVEQDLLDSQERYHGLADATFEAIFISEKGICVDVNQMVSKMYGYDYSESIGMYGTDFIAPEFKKTVEKNMLSGYEEPYDAIAQRKDGTTFYCEIRGRMTMYKGKKLRVTSVRNVDEHVRAKKELHESELKYKTLYNTSRDAIMMLTPDKGFFAGNTATVEIFGCKNEIQFISQKPSTLSPEYQPDGALSSEKSQQMMGLALKNGSHFFEWKHKKINGSEFYATVLLTKMKLQKQDMLQATVRDITKEKQAQEELGNHRNHLEKLVSQRTWELEKINVQLQKAKNKAEESDNLKSAFLSNMSHEIRTPMNSIIGFSELLRDREMPEEQKNDFIDIILRQGNSLLNIINDIIDISKIEADKLKINQGICDVEGLVDELYHTFLNSKEIMAKPSVELLFVKPKTNKPVFINSDPDRIRQVLSNLIINAIKFTSEGHIKIGYSILGDNGNKRIRFSVKDTGIGIGKEKQDIVFDRFRQVDESHTREYGGTGLGLYISKRIVGLLGGEIGFESELGEGSVFYFTIPFVKFRVMENARKTEKSNGLVYSWPDKTILIVEDDRDSFLLLKQSLVKTNVSIIHTFNGKSSVEICSTNPNIDLVIMDVQLPGMNGYDAMQLIKAERESLPVIAQTAHALAGDKEKYLAFGFNDYIAKPIIIKSLLVVLDKYLKS